MTEISEAIRIHSDGATIDERWAVVQYLNRALKRVESGGAQEMAAAYALRMAIQDIRAGKHAAD